LLYNRPNGIEPRGENMAQPQLVPALAEKCEVIKKTAGMLVATLGSRVAGEV
jgi:hypothetical protein